MTGYTMDLEMTFIYLGFKNGPILILLPEPPGEKKSTGISGAEAIENHCPFIENSCIFRH